MADLRYAANRGAELVGAAIFACMFGAFLLQIFMRYVVNQPLGWTLELCSICYVWLAFWGSAFLLRERDHVTFNLISHSVSPPARRVMALLSAVAIAAAMVAALPATFDFVSFMERMRTDVLRWRFDSVYSVFIVFMAAVAVRQVIRAWRLSRPGWRDALDR